jgi:electron transfer flavoprotein alpha subunit
MNRERDIVVSLETSGENREEINGRLLTAGAGIADRLQGSLSVMILGGAVEDKPSLEAWGVSTLYRVEGVRLSGYNPEVFAWAAQEALRDVPFRLLLFAHTDRGSELAPRVASYLGTAAVTGCVDIRIREGILFYARLVYGGQFEQEISYTALPEVATVMPEAFDTREARGSAHVAVRTVNVEVPPDIVGSTFLESIPPDYRTVDILYAKRIVGAGSGCGNLSLVEELCHLLEGSVGATRPVVDDGHLPKERMIGQTGKTVMPDLYVALGISGSPHHVAGIQQTKNILSVNKDPRAPIFNVSDAGFVCDLNAVLPGLINRIKRFRDEGLA